MANKDKRFQRAYPNGKMSGIEIIIDTETGVNYLFAQAGYAGGLTPLLDKDGKPVITKIEEE